MDTNSSAAVHVAASPASAAKRARNASLVGRVPDEGSPHKPEQETVEKDPYEELRCPFCKDIYRTPLQLHCGHSLCKPCAAVLYSFAVLQSFEMCTSKLSVSHDSAEEDNECSAQMSHNYVDSLACPVCHRLSPLDAQLGADSLAVEESLATECDKVRDIVELRVCGWCSKETALEECSKCEVVYCEACKHRFYPIGVLEEQRFQICKRHKGRRKDIFCTDCNCSLCLYCVKLDKVHNVHQLISLPDGVALQEKRLGELKSRVEYRLRELTAYKDTLLKSTNAVKEGYQSMEDSIKTTFQRLRELVDEREQQLLQFVGRRMVEDHTLGKALLGAIDQVEQHASAVVTKEPKEAQDPEVVMKFMDSIDSLGKNLDDLQLESSLAVGLFEFNMGKFEVSLREASKIREKLELDKIDSNLASEEQLQALTSFLATQIQGKKQCSLVYKASQLGWSEKKFHSRLAGLSEPTFFIATTEGGHIVGGFRTIPWDGSNSVEGPGAFLFSLGDGKSRLPVMLENKYAVSMSVREMSGKNRDLQVFLDRQAIVAHLGQTFAVPLELQDQAQELLIGGVTARLVDFEVFSIGNPQMGADYSIGGPKHQAILRGHMSWKKALTAWIGQPYHMHNLLYKASQDGWFDEIFHEKCDNKGATLVIAKSEGFIFGGFTRASWGGMNITYKGFVYDDKAFLFSLTDGHGRLPSKLELVHAKFAIQNDFKAGPNFGAGNDLRLELKEQMVKCCPHSYKVPTGFRADHFLCGATSARLDEVEVYYIPDQ